MCDFFNDYDDFENGDSFEDEFDEDMELDDPLAGDYEFKNETDPAASKDGEFTPSDAFIVGGAMGYVYHEGRRERKRRKRRRFTDD